MRGKNHPERGALGKDSMHGGGARTINHELASPVAAQPSPSGNKPQVQCGSKTSPRIYSFSQFLSISRDDVFIF